MKIRLSFNFFILIMLICQTGICQCPVGEHFWCAFAEAEIILRGNTTCYKPEGFSFSLSSTNTGGLTPVYRFYSEASNIHFYSTSKDEGINAGYKLEGSTGYAASGSQPGTIPIYRFYNPTNGYHFYTPDRNGELALKDGYNAEGIAFYAWPAFVKDESLIRFYVPEANPTKLTTAEINTWNEICKEYREHEYPPCKGCKIPVTQYPNLGKISFYNSPGSGESVVVYGVLTKATNGTFDFCGSEKFINCPLDEGQSSPAYQIPNGLILVWQVHTLGDCNNDTFLGGSSKYYNTCNPCTIKAR